MPSIGINNEKLSMCLHWINNFEWNTKRVKRHSLPEAFQSHRVFFIIPLKVAKVQYELEHIESTKIASNHDGEKPKNIIQ